MGLSNKKEEQLKKMPQIETKMRKSKDGRYLIQQTIITSIKPVAYYEAVIEDKDYQGSEEEIVSIEE